MAQAKKATKELKEEIEVPLTLPNRDARFAPSTTKKSYDVKRGELTPRQEEICSLVARGAKPKDIADHMDCSVQSVVNLQNSDLGKDHIRRLRRALDIQSIEVSKKYLELQDEAAETIHEIMREGEKDEVRLKAAIHVAGIGGHSPVSKSSHSHAHAIFTVEDIDEMAGRIDKEKGESNEIQEAEIVD